MLLNRFTATTTAKKQKRIFQILFSFFLSLNWTSEYRNIRGNIVSPPVPQPEKALRRHLPVRPSLQLEALVCDAQEVYWTSTGILQIPVYYNPEI